jgi:hypothetical protein
MKTRSFIVKLFHMMSGFWFDVRRILGKSRFLCDFISNLTIKDEDILFSNTQRTEGPSWCNQTLQALRRLERVILRQEYT